MALASNTSLRRQFTPSPGAHGLPGRLFVVEGADRSGRSTQIDLLVAWLETRGYPVVRTDWSTSPHISKAIHKAKAENALRTVTFSLFYAADFADRIANVMIPSLGRGEIVVADRFVYTAFARDAARGADREWLHRLYSFAPTPDAVFYLSVPPAVRARREPSAAVKARDTYEFGLDLDLSADPHRSFEIYQQRVYDEFERMVGEFELTAIDGEQDVDVVQGAMRTELTRLLS